MHKLSDAFCPPKLQIAGSMDYKITWSWCSKPPLSFCSFVHSVKGEKSTEIYWTTLPRLDNQFHTNKYMIFLFWFGDHCFQPFSYFTTTLFKYWRMLIISSKPSGQQLLRKEQPWWISTTRSIEGSCSFGEKLSFGHLVIINCSRDAMWLRPSNDMSWSQLLISRILSTGRSRWWGRDSRFWKPSIFKDLIHGILASSGISCLQRWTANSCWKAKQGSLFNLSYLLMERLRRQGKSPQS